MSATDATALDGPRQPQLASPESLPPLAALFLIKFDLKVGYTIAWKRSIDGIDLDRAAVEFKSLPSGLHTVQEDLVYFVHDRYVGLSAFVRGAASQEERNAHFVAVGILVPVSHGRLGRGWLHAQKLQEHAKLLAGDTTETAVLEEYWSNHVLQNKGHSQSHESLDASLSIERPPPRVVRANNGKGRGLTALTDLRPSQDFLGAMHPALSIMKYIDTFGPLIFPLHRAALLRKRILFLTSPPVRLACEFVYDLCILSSIPSSVDEVLPEDCENLRRLRSLFTVGVHDIPFLQDEAKKHSTDPTTEEPDTEDWSPGWAACSTDGVLASKTNLYDVIVELPAASEHAPQSKQQPKIRHADGTEILATQRDLRRFRILYHELKKVHQRPEVQRDDEEDGEAEAEPENDEDEDEDEGENEDESPLLPHPAQGPRTDSNSSASAAAAAAADDDDDDELNTDGLIEPMTWSALAYSGFMWWASAGERDSSLSDEADRDRALLGDMGAFIAMSPAPFPRPQRDSQDAMSQSWYAGAAAPHTALIAYFHRLTAEVFNAVSEAVEAAEDEGRGEAEEDGEGVVDVHGDDVARMGLDVWSVADRAFVGELVGLYWGRRAQVYGANVECCGIKIC